MCAIGVLHHVPDPRLLVQAAFRALRPGGTIAVWLYGREGNGLYLALVEPLRTVTTRLPHAVLAVLSGVLAVVRRVPRRAPPAGTCGG